MLYVLNTYDISTKIFLLHKTTVAGSVVARAGMNNQLIKSIWLNRILQLKKSMKKSAWINTYVHVSEVLYTDVYDELYNYMKLQTRA